MLVTSDINPDIRESFIAYDIQDGIFMPWSPTQNQILATDWNTIEAVAEVEKA